jgi:hypothetical protein
VRIRAIVNLCWLVGFPQGDELAGAHVKYLGQSFDGPAARSGAVRHFADVHGMTAKSLGYLSVRETIPGADDAQ